MKTVRKLSEMIANQWCALNLSDRLEMGNAQVVHPSDRPERKSLCLLNQLL